MYNPGVDNERKQEELCVFFSVFFLRGWPALPPLIQWGFRPDLYRPWLMAESTVMAHIMLPGQ